MVRVIARLNIGGPAVHLGVLTQHLSRRGYEQHLVAGCTGDDEANYDDGGGSLVAGELHRVPALRRGLLPAHDLYALVGIARVLRHLRPDIVETHTAKAGTIGRLAARLAGVPRVVHVYHGHVLSGYFSAPVSSVMRALERRLAGISDHLVCVSEACRRELLAARVGRPDQFSVIRLGFDLSRFASSVPTQGGLRTELNLEPSAVLFGVVARLVPVKGHARLLEAFAAVVAAESRAHLVVVGDGGLRRRLEQQCAEFGIRRHVHFLGWRSDMPRIYRDLDVVALASINEGLPVCLIEAQAAGCAVVATDVGGVPEIVDDGRTGILVSSSRLNRMGETLTELARNPILRASLASAGRLSALDRFSVSRMVGQFDALYRKLSVSRDPVG